MALSYSPPPFLNLDAKMGEGGGWAIRYLLPPSVDVTDSQTPQTCLRRPSSSVAPTLLTPSLHAFTNSSRASRCPRMRGSANASRPELLRSFISLLRERERERERDLMADAFVEVGVPGQRSVGGVRFPAVLAPVPAAAGLDLPRFTEAVRVQKARVEALLRSSGAVLLRGFPVRTAADFDAAVEAFGYEELPYVGGAAPRTNVVGRVFTANESPPDQKIPFHHEMAQVPEFPSKLFFFCEEEPGSGGETPIVLSHRIYERMREKYPDFVERLDRHGLIYTRVLGAGDDPSSPIGRGWQSTFLTKDRSTAEERGRRLGMKLEWTEDGVKTIMGPIPAIKFDASRQRNIWFNSMVAAYTGWKDARNDPVKAVTFGDGSPLPSEVIDGCLKILEEECVAMPWKQGDILLLDNLAVLHARRSFDPPRRILASLCK